MRSKSHRGTGCFVVEPLESRLLLSAISPFELSSLLPANGGDGTTGFVINGVDAVDYSGYSVSSAGDINGDGFDDLIIGANGADPNGKGGAGESYVVFGKNGGFPAGLDLAALDGTNGFVINGIDVRDVSGNSVSGAGDINGDGFDDLVIGAPLARPSGVVRDGESYVIFGKAGGFAASLELSSLDGTNGFVIKGSLSGFSGRAVSGAGDFNGDGFDDLVIGANGAGKGYVVFGKASGFTASFSLSTLNGANGFQISFSSSLGFSVSGAGDINGDGFDDLIIGAPGPLNTSYTNIGKSYVLFGKAGGFNASFFLSTLNGTNGFAIDGIHQNGQFGHAVSGAGDINGDGFDDLIAGAFYAKSNGVSFAGESYVIFGKASGFSSRLNLTSLNGTNGFVINGIGSFDQSGFSVSGAGDINGDGFDDLIIGARYGDPGGRSDASESYVIFGKSGGFAPNFHLSTLDGINGFIIHGINPNDEAGFSVSGAGDVNADGFDDLIIGAWHADPNGNFSAGESYVVFGGDFTALGDADMVFTGDAAANVLVGALGNDTLIGNGGADVLRGGSGDDILAIADLDFARIVGGNGSDTLRLDTTGLSLDLTAIPDNRITGIETIDLTGSGPNTLTLNALEVLNLSDASNTLIVQRDGDDTVNMGAGWALTGSEVIGFDTFDVYTRGTATLKIAQTISTPLDGDLNGDGFVGITDLNLVLDNWNQTAPPGNPLADTDGDGFVGINDLNAVLGNWAAGASQTIETPDLLLANGGDGTAGFIIKGAGSRWNYTGQSVSSAGDINGDGFDDMIVGAPGGYFAYGDRPGQSYVVFGKAGGFPAELDPATLDGTNGFVIRGINNGDYAGRSVSGAGDINGDGLDDLIVGSPGSWFSPSAKSGDCYVIFGKTSGFTADLDLAAIDGTNGFAIHGIDAKDRTGTSVSGAGDINGDGFDDVIIGIWREYRPSDARNVAPGESYVVFGKAGGFGADVDLAALDGTNGFLINGTNTGDYAGGSVSGAGDVNGDGFDDLIVGAPQGFLNPGLTGTYGGSFVVFGKANGFAATLELADLDGVSGFAIRGVNIGDFTGFSVSGAGDVNGDGYDDLVVGAMNARPDSIYLAGTSYVIFGHGGGYAADVDLASLDGNNGFTVYGTRSYLDLGTSVSGAGDLNADGYDDLIFGASGHSYVIFGSPGGFTANFDLSSLNGINGFTINGTSVSSVSDAGDVNGDGFDDLIIGAGYSNVGYVIFGGNFTGAVSQNGTNTGNLLIGSAAADVLVGGQANDTLVGNGGADVLRGGEGDDVLAVSDFNFVRLAGGNGLDTLRLDMPGVAVNLATLTGNRVTGIEAIDLADSDPDTLALRVADVLRLSDESNTLTVLGDTSDTVIVDAGWIFSGIEVTGSNTFNVYTQGAATLKIAQPVMIPPVAGIDTLATSDTTPNLTGVAQLLALGGATIDTIHVTVAGTTYTATDHGDGTWSLPGSTFSSALPDGVYDVVVTVTDTQGNIGTDTTHDELVIDTVDPVVTVDTLSTIDHAPQLTGTIADADPNTTILVTVAGTTYTATNNGDGTWVLADNKIAPHLPLGAYDVAVTAIDAAGNVGSDTTTDELTVRFGIVRLADLLPANGGDGTAGFVIGGTGAGGNFGVSVSNAGDVNGDGLDDMIIKAGSAGRGYVVFGRTNGFDDLFDLSTLDGTNGFVIYGARSSISAAGDVNADGFDDLIVGDSSADPNGESNAGKSYVIFGKANGFGATVSLSSLDGSNGFAINGIDHFDGSGTSVSGIGDINGDGFDDVAIGAPSANYSTFSSVSYYGDSKGESYVVFGKAGGFDAEIELSDLDGTNGFIIPGFEYASRFGRAVNGAGDINGDGFDDLIVGAPNANAQWDYHYLRGDGKGESYVIFGKAGGFDRFMSVRSLDGSDGFAITGSEQDEHMGHSVASAGDINGDGFDDLIVGTDSGRDADGKPRAGEAYIIFGKAGGYAAAINISTLDGTNGFAVTGAEQDFLGRSVSGAGDVNGDGYDDLIIGADSADPYGQSAAGESYVIFGRPGGYPAVIVTANLDGTNGFIIPGTFKGDRSGSSVSGAGDVNGDGFDDLIVGAPGWSQPDADGSGGSFIIFGGDFTAAVTQNGTAAADVLAGTGAVDVLIGGQGDDELVSNGGADVLRGGEGDDILAVSDLNFAKIVGGNGVDTLRLDGVGQTLDLTAIPDNRFTGIEAIDITGSGDNTLTLNRLEVLNLSDESNTLIVRGDAGDLVNTGLGWTLAGTELIGPDTFNVYTQGAATLKVAQTISTPIDGDLNGDGFVGIADLNIVLGAWNQSVPPVDPLANPSGDGFVGIADLNVVLGNWNAGTPPAATAVARSSSAGESLEPRLLLSATNPFELSSLLAVNGGDGTAGIVINGIDALDRSGWSVSSAGDINGDGFDDLIIGAHYADPNGNSYAGESYVVFGKASGFAADLNLSTLNGANGFVINGIDPGDQSGFSVSGAGDINGDGFDDLIIGSRYADPNGSSAAGESYVVFGKAFGFAAVLNLSAVNGTNGFVINGIDPGDQSGRSVSSAGDINGDGFDDLIIGADISAPNGNNLAGESYVVFGKASGFAAGLNLSTLNGANGFVINGIDPSDHSGFSVSSAGDINGDGFDDLVIGAWGAAPSGNSSAGESYVIFGKASGFAAVLDLSALNGANGFVINGIDTHDRSGGSVSSAGDINSDGFDDLIIGARTADTNDIIYAGESYVVFGKASGFAAGLDLSALNGTNGYVINGIAKFDYSGRSVSSAGDINGDGFDDLLIGAPRADPNGKSSAGESYVIFGGDFTGAVTQNGTAAADVLTGTPAVDVLIGGQGNDTLIGNGGADVLRGGEGDDILAIADLGFARLVGGNGTDTLRLDATGLTLDLTAIADNRITGIETIDITGSGPNTLTLNALEVLNLSDTSNTLIVRGDGDDTVNMGAGWTLAGTELIDSQSFNVFVQGAANVKIAAAIPRPVVDGIELSSLLAANGGDGTAGFVINGIDTDDRSGWSVSSAGDINGDGFDDLIIGAYAADPNGNGYAGESYVVFGKASGFAAGLELSALNGANGFVINGIDTNDYSGRSVSGAGDINGDGFDDLIIGADFADPNGNSYAGESYVVFGKASGFAAVLDLSALNGANGFVINGIDTLDQSGFSVGSAGDINGDGFDDLIIGARTADPNGNSAAGESYVVFGKASGFAAVLDLSALNGANGFVINGIDAGDRSGRSVSGAGDINGDGFDDLIIGADFADPNGNSSAGESYVVFGKASGFAAGLNLSALNGTNGFVINGIDTDDRSGWSVSGTGDINGDGFDDLIIGADFADPNGNSFAGESYVVFGKASGFAAGLNLSALNGTNGFVINGIDALDRSGRSVSSAGDINGDGFDDLIIGADFADPNGNSYAGESYVVFGKASGFAAVLDLSALNGANGFVINGIDTNDYSGRSVSSAGDINGDGFDDLIIGARFATPNGNNAAGESYVVFGGDFTNLGETGVTLNGDAAANILIGGLGNDTLIGNGGTDVQRGGKGDDILAVSDLNFAKIVGGNGSDTLRLDTTGLSLDLTAIPDNRITGIETIDLTGSGPNTLTLNALEVLNLSDASNTLIVQRDGDDTVNMGAGWALTGSEVIGLDTFDVYTQGAATLKVAQTISTPLDGDLNGDGFVGITDLNLVLGNWNQSVPPGDPLADPSGDGFVGIADLNVMLGNWNAGTPPAATAVASSSSADESLQAVTTQAVVVVKEQPPTRSSTRRTARPPARTPAASLTLGRDADTDTSRRQAAVAAWQSRPGAAAARPSAFLIPSAAYTPVLGLWEDSDDRGE